MRKSREPLYSLDRAKSTALVKAFSFSSKCVLVLPKRYSQEEILIWAVKGLLSNKRKNIKKEGFVFHMVKISSLHWWFKDMESQLSLSAIQTDFWRQSQEFATTAEQIEALLQPNHILPEMFTTGFTMAAEKFAEHARRNSEWLRYWAEKNRWLLEEVPSLKKTIHLQPLFIGRSFRWSAALRQSHTFTLAGEDKAYTTGKNDGLINYRMKICQGCVTICVSRFGGRNTSDYDLLIYTANCPQTHRRLGCFVESLSHWKHDLLCWSE